MHPQIEALFDEAETRYLNAEELTVINQYVDSLPARIDAYRALRDHEIAVMQSVADQLQSEVPEATVEALERSIKNALLLLRYCAMGMLLQDQTFVQERLLSWLTKTVAVYETTVIDTVLYRLLNQRLSEVLSAQQMQLLSPYIAEAQDALIQTAEPASAVRRS